MSLKLVRFGEVTVSVDEETYEIAKLMIEDLPRPVHESDLRPVVLALRADGYHDAIVIALAARDQVARDNFWTDQILDDAYFAEQGAPQ